jgi:hypothetical protein
MSNDKISLTAVDSATGMDCLHALGYPPSQVNVEAVHDSAVPPARLNGAVSELIAD